MTVNDVCNLLGAQAAALADGQREVTGGMVCDLLSHVMAGGKEGMAWVTVQTHMNVVAVAALHDMACILLPAGIKMDDAPRAKALEQGISVLSCPQEAYQIAGILYSAGLK